MLMIEPKMSAAAGLISIVSNKAASLLSFLSFIMWCIFHSFIISIQEFYFFFHCATRFFSFLLRALWAAVPQGSREAPVPRPTCQAHDTGITREDAQFVMEKLGLSRGLNSENGSLLEVGEVRSLLEDVELEEVREAFGVLDQNKDGFIDRRELGSVMECIGLVGFSDDELGRMIVAFDEDGDGRIDFREFVKFMEDCSC